MDYNSSMNCCNVTDESNTQEELLSVKFMGGEAERWRRRGKQKERLVHVLPSCGEKQKRRLCFQSLRTDDCSESARDQND